MESLTYYLEQHWKVLLFVRGMGKGTGRGRESEYGTVVDAERTCIVLVTAEECSAEHRSNKVRLSYNYIQQYNK